MLTAAGGKIEGGGFEIGDNGEIGSRIEDLIPSGKAHKPLWARGLDMLGYSLNSFRFANLEFKDASSERFSQMIRLKLNSDETQKLLAVSHFFSLQLSFIFSGKCLMGPTFYLKSQSDFILV